MHKNYFLLITTLLFFNSLWAQIPNGFYVGETCDLKEANIVYYNTPLKVQVDKPLKFKSGYIHSSNNKNDLHRISLEVEKVPENTWLVLKIDDSYFATCLRSKKSKRQFGTSKKSKRLEDDEDKTKEDTLSSKGGFVIEKRSDAEIISNFLKIDIVDRNHFGHQLAGEIKTSKANYNLGDSILLDFTLFNKGQVPLKLAWDNYQKESTSTTDKFLFRVIFQGKSLKKKRDPNESTFVSGNATPKSILQVGDRLQIKIDLRRWFDFKTSGEYYITWNYRMQLTNSSKPFNPERAPEFYWDDEVKGSFVLVIK